MRSSEIFPELLPNPAVHYRNIASPADFLFYVHEKGRREWEVVCMPLGRMPEPLVITPEEMKSRRQRAIKRQKREERSMLAAFRKERG